MDGRTLFLLGGYGNTGQWIARMLLEETDVRLVLAGRSRAKAEAAAAGFNQIYGGRVAACAVDAADGAALKAALDGSEMVVVAASTSAYTATVARAALAAGADYLDVQYAPAKLGALRALEAEITRSGRCFITDAGFHPGLPAALIRYAVPHFDRLRRAVVGSVIQIDWAGLSLSDATAPELIEAFKDYEMLVYRDGRWQRAPWWSTKDFVHMDFGPPFGVQRCAPMWLEELRDLPTQLIPLEATGFYVGGFNPVVDNVVLPVVLVALRLWPKAAVAPMARLLAWGLRTFSRPPYGTRLKLEATGLRDGREETATLLLQHEDGYAFTAIPTVACLLQYLDGTIRRPGLWFQATAVDPARLLVDMERMGIGVEDGLRHLEPA